MKWVAAGTALAAVLGVAAVVLLARTPAEPAFSGPQSARASLSPPVVQFGDRVTAHVDVANAHSARIDASFGPLTQLSAPRVTHDENGVHYSVQLSCLDQVCAAERKTFTLPDAHVNGVAVKWPLLVVRGRATKAEVARDPTPLRADPAPRAVSYRFTPSRTAWVLEALAVLLVLGGVALAGMRSAELARERRRRATRPTQLERALVLARQSEQRDATDRRRAVGLVARLLARRGEELAAPAADLAWSPSPPDADEIERLVSEVERTR